MFCLREPSPFNRTCSALFACGSAGRASVPAKSATVRGCSYGVAKDQWNEVLFEPVVTDGLRLQAEMQPNFSGGILEWRIYPTTTDPIDRSNKTQDSRE